MQFEIRNCWTGAVQFACELSAEVAGESYGVKLGFAVKKALEAGANLSAANLRAADLTPIRDDVWAVLAAAPGEAYAVRDALAAGSVDGSVYEGPCACLVGTIANARGCKYDAIEGLRPASWRPAERFFMSILSGHFSDEFCAQADLPREVIAIFR